MLKKILVISIIFLILNLASTPSIFANFKNNEELIEIEVDYCGFDRKKTVKLTYEESKNLDYIFNEINQKLSGEYSTTEAIIIINKIINKFDKSEKIKKIFTEKLHNINIIFYDKKNQIVSENETDNCIIIGKTNLTEFQSRLAIFSFNLKDYPDKLYDWSVENENKNLQNIIKLIKNNTQFILFSTFCLMIFVYALIFSYFNPLPTGYRINLGFAEYETDEQTNYYYSHGWIRTFSTTGSRHFNGSFRGDLPLDGCSWGGGVVNNIPYPAVTGFAGIKINNKNTNNVYYLGLASKVKIKYAE